jgi:hypothetical protein
MDKIAEMKTGRLVLIVALLAASAVWPRPLFACPA